MKNEIKSDRRNFFKLPVVAAASAYLLSGFNNAEADLAIQAPLIAGPLNVVNPGPYGFNFGYTAVRNFYVATAGNGGSDSNDGLSATVGGGHGPWLTLQHADSTSRAAGDVINVGPGVFSQPYGFNPSNGGNANSAAGYVVYKGSPNHQTVLNIIGATTLASGTATGSVYHVIAATANYLIFDGFYIDSNGVNSYAIANGAGTVSNVSGVPTNSGGNHHIIVINNIVTSSGLYCGGGIGFSDTDYYLIANNNVFNTCLSNYYLTNGPIEESGISVYEPCHAISGFTPSLAWDTTNVFGLGNGTSTIQIINNISHDNYISSANFPGSHTDGNGIILDDWSWSQNSPNLPYTGQPGLVANNLVYHNGMQGIEIFYTPSAIIVGNTCYNNHWDTDSTATYRGEILIQNSGSYTVYNNICWAVVGTSGITSNNNAILEAAPTGSGGPFYGNITYNGTPGQSSTSFATSSIASTFAARNIPGTLPGVNSIGTNDFRLPAGSNCISTGTYLSGYTLYTLYGFSENNPPNIGAY